MKDIDQIRRENLLILEEEAGSPTAMAARVGMGYSQYINLRKGVKDSKTGKPRGMRKETARKIESAYGKPPGWLDIDHSANGDSNIEEGLSIQSARLIPIIGEVKGGMDGYLEETSNPSGFLSSYCSDKDAFAVRVRGDSMYPRFKPGEFVIISPNLEAQPGDDVVVALSDGRKMLKVFGWQRDGEIQLLSINDAHKPITISESQVHQIHVVTGMAHRSSAISI